MEFKQDFVEALRKAANKKRKCMYHSCTSETIKSHVFQKNGILRQISKDNHLIQLVVPSPFENEKSLLSRFTGNFEILANYIIDSSGGLITGVINEEQFHAVANDLF